MSRAVRLKLQLSWHVRLWHMFIRLLFLLLALVVFLAGCYWFLTLPRFRLTGVALSGATMVEQRALEERIGVYLTTPRFGIIPRDTIFTVGKDELANALLAGFPRLQSVRANWSGKTTLAISLLDRSPRYVWSKVGAAEDARYLADADSFIFTRATSSVPSVLFRLSGGVAGIPVGATVFREEELTWMRLLIGDLAPLGVTLNGAAVEGNDDLTFMTAEGWTLKVNTRINGRAVAVSLAAVLRAFDGTGKGGRERLEYVDLRFPNKAYFRLRDVVTTALP